MGPWDVLVIILVTIIVGGIISSMVVAHYRNKKAGGACAKCGTKDQNVAKILQKYRQKYPKSVENTEIPCPHCSEEKAKTKP
jgi:hypothetical protein